MYFECLLLYTFPSVIYILGLEVDDSVLVNALTVSDSNQGALGIYNVSVSSPEQVTAEEIAFTNPDVTNIIEGTYMYKYLYISLYTYIRTYMWKL